MDLVVGNYQGGLDFFKGTALPTGISEQPQAATINLSVFPNPAHSTVTVQVLSDNDGMYTLELYDLVGQKVLSEKMNGNRLTVDTENIRAGIYMCKVTPLARQGTQADAGMTKKIVVQH